MQVIYLISFAVFMCGCMHVDWERLTLLLYLSRLHKITNLPESNRASLFDIRKKFKFCGVRARPIISGVLFFQPLIIIKYNMGKMHDKGSTFKPRTRRKPGVPFDVGLQTPRFWCFQKKCRAKGVNVTVWQTFIEKNSVTYFCLFVCLFFLSCFVFVLFVFCFCFCFFICF